MRTHVTRIFSTLTAASLLLALAACSEDTSTSTGTTAGAATNAATSTAPAGPDLSDGRALADWAAVKVATRETTDICQYGTVELKKELGKYGYCEQNPTFVETAVTLDLIGTCDASQGGSGKTPPGDLYMYRVEPSLSMDPKGPESGIQVIVLKDGDSYSVNSIVFKSAGGALDGNPDCPDATLTPTSGSVPLD